MALKARYSRRWDAPEVELFFWKGEEVEVEKRKKSEGGPKSKSNCLSLFSLSFLSRSETLTGRLRGLIHGAGVDVDAQGGSRALR